MASRQLIVKIVGDAHSLDRTLKNSTRTAKTFSAQMDKSARTVSGFSRGLVTGFAGAAALSVVTQALKDMVVVAAEAQQVLTQTKFALEQAGATWTQYGDQIEDVIEAQSRLGFDDEALLRSLALFLRSTDDVTVALERNALAMDVARATGMDYEAAASLVAAAAIGQTRAFRQLRIAIPPNATALQLLTILEQKFGGAAENASEDASTAMDRFKVSAENAQEALGENLLPMVGDLADLAAIAADKVGSLSRALDSLGGGKGKFALSSFMIPPLGMARMLGLVGGGGGGGGLDAVGKSITQTLKDFGTVITHAIEKETNALRQRTGPTRAMRNQWFDARIAREMFRLEGLTTQQQIVRLRLIAEELRTRLAITKDRTRYLKLEDDLLAVEWQLLDVQQAQAEASKAAAEAAKEAARQAREAARERQETRLFGLLGLGPGGAAAIPGVQALRNRFERIADDLRGTKLEAKLRTRMQRLARVLADPLLKAFPEVRRVIEQELAKIDALLEQRTQRRPMHFRAVSPDDLLRGLGLSPAQMRAALDRLSAASGGTVPKGTRAAFGTGLAGATVINIHGDVVTPDSNKFIRDMQKRAKRSRPQQRGVRPGVNVGGA